MLGAKSFFETPATQLTPQMEQEFFSSLMGDNKTYKTTYHRRFSDINSHLVQYLKKHDQQVVRVLDIGVSSGISTLELWDDLGSCGIDASIVATDTLIDAFLVRVLLKCHVLVDARGFPLRIDLPVGSIKPWVTSSDYRSGFFVLRKAINAVLSRRAKKILLNSEDRRAQPIKLVTPRLQDNRDIVICNDDISQFNSAFVDRFDFIRAANVLNKGYFSPTVLATMLANIGRYLSKPSATLLVVRTHEDGANHGTLFRLGSDNSFEVIYRIGEGSEIENIVLQSLIQIK